jgi:outer membrane protein assembly factor BamB
MTGEVAWKSIPGEAGYAALAVTRVGERDVLLVFHGTGLAGLDARDGSVIWDVPWETRHGTNATTPAVGPALPGRKGGATVFISSHYGMGCAALAVGDSGAEVVWRNETIASHHSDPVILDGFVYCYSGWSRQNRGHLKCVELATGEEKWSAREVGWGTLVLVDGHLLCLDIKGNLYLVRPDPGGFVKVAEFPKAISGARNPCWTAPVVANGKVYLRYRQRLICYDLRER